MTVANELKRRPLKSVHAWPGGKRISKPLTPRRIRSPYDPPILHPAKPKSMPQPKLVSPSTLQQRVSHRYLRAFRLSAGWARASTWQAGNATSQSRRPTWTGTRVGRGRPGRRHEGSRPNCPARTSVEATSDRRCCWTRRGCAPNSPLGTGDPGAQRPLTSAQRSASAGSRQLLLSELEHDPGGIEAPSDLAEDQLG